MNVFKFKPEGVCSSYMEFTIDNNRLHDIMVLGGCSGNMKGIKSLILGLPIETIIEKLDGIKCGAKKSSCPEQIARALKEYLKESK